MEPEKKKVWRNDEIRRLINAMLRYRQTHPEGGRSWQEIWKDTGLQSRGFTFIQCRDKWFNLRKKKTEFLQRNYGIFANPNDRDLCEEVGGRSNHQPKRSDKQRAQHSTSSSASPGTPSNPWQFTNKSSKRAYASSSSFGTPNEPQASSHFSPPRLSRYSAPLTPPHSAVGTPVPSPRSSPERVHDPLHGVFGVRNMPQTYLDQMEEKKRRESLAKSYVSSPQAAPSTRCYSEDAETVKKDLELCARFVQGPVLVSKTLYEYIGKSFGIRFETFKELGKTVIKNLPNLARDYQPKFSGECSIHKDMELLKTQFGQVFNRLNYVEADNGVLSDLVDGFEETTSGGDAATDNVEGNQCSAENLLAANGNDFGGDFMTEFVVTEELNASMRRSSPVAGSSSMDLSCCVSVTGASPKEQLGPKTAKRARKESTDAPSVKASHRNSWELYEEEELPKGYKAHFTTRWLVDAEWRKVLAYSVSKGENLGHLDEGGWPCFLTKVGIVHSKTGLSIMEEFYSRLLPKLQDPAFKKSAEGIKLFLTEADRWSMLTIYHAIKEPTQDGIEACIADLLQRSILSHAKENAATWWNLQFMYNLCCEKWDFFCITEEKYKEVVKSVLASCTTTAQASGVSSTPTRC